MADITIPVGSYSLTLGIEGAIGYRRHLWITSHPSYTGAIRATSLAFVPSVSAAPASAIVGGNQIRAYTALSDFDTYHRVLQTESPLVIQIRETNQKLDFFWLGTWMEPTGEGFEDFSP